jgi:hypothetical protein
VVVILGPAAFSLVVAGVYVLLGGSWEVAGAPALRSGTALVLLPLFLVILIFTDGLASGSREGEDAVCPHLSVAAIRHQGEAKYERVGGFLGDTYRRLILPLALFLIRPLRESSTRLARGGCMRPDLRRTAPPILADACDARFLR